MCQRPPFDPTLLVCTRMHEMVIHPISKAASEILILKLKYFNTFRTSPESKKLGPLKWSVSVYVVSLNKKR